MVSTLPRNIDVPAPASELRPLTKLSIARKAATVACHVAWERARRERPTSTERIPRSIEALTTQWLTDALCAEVPGAQVTDFEVIGGSNGTTDRRALRVAYNAAGQAAGLPDRVFAKATPRLTSRLLTGPVGALRGETAFYNSIRPGLPIEAPQSYYAAVDERSYRSIVLIEDVTVTRGARFGSPADLPVSRPMAESMVRQMAAYHAAFWQSPRFAGDLAWLPTAQQWQDNTNNVLPYDRRCLVGFDRAGAVIPDELKKRKADVLPAFTQSLALNARAAETLVHFDVHLGNWYVLDSGEMGQHDWQVLVRGHWALDLSYALTSALRIDDRRLWERQLLEIYLAGLAEGGVETAPTFEEAFLAYRQQIFHGLTFWLFTIGRSPFQPKMQPDEVSLANLERMAQAVVDLQSLDACARI
jgi:hypothetical protein